MWHQFYLAVRRNGMLLLRILFPLFFLVLFSFSLFFDDDSVQFFPLLSNLHSFAPSCAVLRGCERRDAMCYIPNQTLSIWDERDFFIVLGIPSEDHPDRRRRRMLQRQTCWTLPGVANRKNHYTGSMLILYVLGRHPFMKDGYSRLVLQEAFTFHDVVALDMNDAAKTTRKQIGFGGKWGFQAEVGMSRKTFLWFRLALRTFRNAKFIGKGDDDMFLRVPQYLSDLMRVQRRGLYWGHMMLQKRRVYRKVLRFYFAFGSCYTLERSVAEAFVSVEPLEKLFLNCSDVLDLSVAKNLFLEAEDNMVGLALHRSNYSNFFLIGEELCRFHDIHQGPMLYKFTTDSVMIHHLKEEDYKNLMKVPSIMSITYPKMITPNNSAIHYFECQGN